MCKILLCCNILLDLVLKPGWDGNDKALEERTKNLEALSDLIASGKATLYIPPDLIQIAHMVASDSLNSEQAAEVTRKILAVGTANLEVDQDQILAQASELAYPDDVELYEVTCLLYAMEMRANAIVTVASSAKTLRQILDLNKQVFSNFNIPILSLDSLVHFLSDDSTKQTDNGESFFTFTPQKRIVRLPKGSTAVDFAYAVHTDIGNRCIKALVNNEDYPLEKPLRKGDIVEIIKGTSITPDPKWLDFSVTTVAKKSIQRYLRKKCQQQGWITLKRELGKNVKHYRKKLELIASQIGCKSIDELAAGIGAKELASKLEYEQLADKIRLREISIQKVRELLWKGSCELEEDCLTSSDQGILTRNSHRRHEISLCCYPLPGQPIVGLSTSIKRPIRVHRQNCPNLKNIEKSQLVALDWKCEKALVQLQICLDNHPDTLRPILNKIAEKWQILCNLHSVNPGSNGLSWILIELTLSQNHNLTHILNDINKMSKVRATKVKGVIPISARSTTVPELQPASATPQLVSDTRSVV